MDYNFFTYGKLVYSECPYKVIVDIDNEISMYYFSTIPKYKAPNRTRYPAHVSVIRNEVPPHLDVWGKHSDAIVKVYYNHYIYEDDLYFWLDAYSKDLEDIRSELGLPLYSGITKSPDGRHKFHITIANKKNKK